MDSKDTRDKLEAGDKKRAGRLLSTFIRQIAQEKIAVEVSEGEAVEVTKAEALARQIWDRALGAFKTVDMKTGAIKHYAPDKDMIHILFDRMEGRVGTFEDEKKKAESIPNKISRKNKQRINKISLTSEDEEECPKDS